MAANASSGIGMAEVVDDAQRSEPSAVGQGKDNEKITARRCRCQLTQVVSNQAVQFLTVGRVVDSCLVHPFLFRKFNKLTRLAGGEGGIRTLEGAINPLLP